MILLDSVRLAAHLLEASGQLRDATDAGWRSSAPSVLRVDARGVATGLREGRAEVTLRADGREATRTFRVVDVPVRVELTARADTVDLDETDFIAVGITGRTGSATQRPVAWSCAPAQLLVSCGPALRSTVVPLDAPVPISVVARSGAVADTLRIVLLERALDTLAVRVAAALWAAGGAAAGQPLSLTLGESPWLTVIARRAGRDVLRQLRITVADPTVARETQSGPTSTLVVSTLRAGSTEVAVAAGGTPPVRFTVVVQGRATTCPAGGTLSLDLALGERRTFRPGFAPGCLEFRFARDANRAYQVVFDAIPAVSGSGAPDALFHVPGAPTPAAWQTVRLWPSSLGPAAARAAGGGRPRRGGPCDRPG